MKKLRSFFLLVNLAITSLTFICANTTNVDRNLPMRETNRWSNHSGKSVPFNPINACITDNKCIVVQLLSDEDSSITLQIKDNFGNLIHQDAIFVTSEEIYQIDLSKFKQGKYTLIYSDKYVEITGEFEIK